MEITIDNNAGFCWGVVRTVDMVEEWLDKLKNRKVYILGQIIHNPHETNRLENLGLETITHADMEKLPQNSCVIIRAHGEPPSTYERAKELGVELIDATCPLVKALQKRVQKFHKEGCQIIIYGKKEHAEVIGLRGFCNDECIVVRSVEEALEAADFSRKTILLSQTTMYKPTLFAIKEALEQKACEISNSEEFGDMFQFKNTICKYVDDREDILKKFSSDNEIIIFVAGRNSSNGKSLFSVCKSVNDRTYFIEDTDELDSSWFDGAGRIGITGATSTPQWFMEHVKNEIEKKMIIN